MDYTLICEKCGATGTKTKVQDRFTAEMYFRRIGWTVARGEPISCAICSLMD